MADSRFTRNGEMTAEQAIRILHPDTTQETLIEIEYFGGFHGEEAMMEAVNKACIVACDALQREIAKEPRHCNHTFYCGRCGKKVAASIDVGTISWCPYCGNKIDWGARNASD